MSEYDNSILNKLRESIEGMEKFNQVEILRILTSHQSVTINENKNGIHINLSDLDNNVLQDLENYVKYVANQEALLNVATMEQERCRGLLQG
jgi:hypothetical protein